MPRKLILSFLTISLLVVSSSFAQKQVLYKQIDSTQLFMEVYQPEEVEPETALPALVFFFGGGWNGGSISQFEPHARYFAQRGVICFLVDYRVKSRQQTSPFESLKDAKSAIRFIRANAKELSIDPTKIIAAGGSAGGHLAAGTALSPGYNEPTDDLNISSIPNALVLFNPVIDNGPGGYGYERIGEAFPSFSPLHSIRAGAPPTIFFLGTEDKLIPVATAEYYKVVMEKVDSRCDLFLYEGAGHGFFNYGNFDYYSQTLTQTDQFLQSLGYLGAEPKVKIE